jgi:hypothetical protein
VGLTGQFSGFDLDDFTITSVELFFVYFKHCILILEIKSPASHCERGFSLLVKGFKV